jgi:GNAT superfamily N-acetyltransferase
VRVRHAVPSDVDALARLHVSSWQSAYAGLVDAGYLARLDAVDRANRWRERIEDVTLGAATYVAVSGIEVVGFITSGPPRDADLDRQQVRWVEVYAVYVHPDHWRRGIGTALWRAAEGDWGSEVAGVALWVLRDNHRAHAFYVARGLGPDGAERSAAIGEQDLAEVRMAHWR